MKKVVVVLGSLMVISTLLVTNVLASYNFDDWLNAGERSWINPSDPAIGCVNGMEVCCAYSYTTTTVYAYLVGAHGSICSNYWYMDGTLKSIPLTQTDNGGYYLYLWDAGSGATVVFGYYYPY